MGAFEVAGLIREAILRANAHGMTASAFARMLEDVQADSKAWAEMSDSQESGE